MMIRVGNDIFKRVGACNGCGLCCREDFINYNAFRSKDSERLEKGDRRVYPMCAQMYKTDGKSRCEVHMTFKYPSGCRRFPWHPLQLSNTIYDDLPRMPVYKSGRYVHMDRFQIGTDEKGQSTYEFRFRESDVTEADFEVVDWKPLSTACGFGFENVTESLKRTRPFALIPNAKDPVVKMTTPSWWK